MVGPPCRIRGHHVSSGENRRCHRPGDGLYRRRTRARWGKFALDAVAGAALWRKVVCLTYAVPASLDLHGKMISPRHGYYPDDADVYRNQYSLLLHGRGDYARHNDARFPSSLIAFLATLTTALSTFFMMPLAEF